MSPSDTVGDRLLVAIERLGRAVRAARQQAATDEGLTVLTVDIVRHLDRRPGVRIGELATELAVTQPTVSDAVARLVDRGLVTRRVEPGDARAAALTLTAAGRRVARRLGERLAALHETGEVDPTAAGAALAVVLGEIRRLRSLGLVAVDRSCLTCAHHRPGTRRTAARCALLDAELRPADLRVDCPEHEPAAA